MIIHSPYDDVALAQVPLTAYVLDGAGERAARPAIIDGPPAALEAVLLAHPAVAGVAVIGRADERPPRHYSDRPFRTGAGGRRAARLSRGPDTGLDTAGTAGSGKDVRDRYQLRLAAGNTSSAGQSDDEAGVSDPA